MARILLLLYLASVGTCDDRYWGSYSAVYPAGGGGNSGALALDLAARQEGWALASRAPTSRALASRPQKPRAPSPRVQETSSSPAQAVVESGQYVHNPEWDLTPFQLWKRKQAAKAGAAKAPLNSLPETVRKVVTVRKQKPRQQQRQQQQQERQQQQLPEQSRFANFHPVAAVEPAAQPTRQQPRRQQDYYQPAPRQAVQKVQPAFRQPAYQAAQPAYQPAQPAYKPTQPIQAVQPAYQQTGLVAYPRAQHHTYTPEYIFEANNNAQRIYSYKAEKYQAKAAGESYSYQATY